MVIIINGSRNAGKTTTANLLAKELNKTAHIEVDVFRWFLPRLNLEQTIPFNLENAVLVANNLLKKKFNVILNYCLREKDHAYLIRHLKISKNKIYTVTLKPDLKTALSYRGRKLTHGDKKRINEQYGKGQHSLPEIGVVINTTGKSLTQVVKIILATIK